MRRVLAYFSTFNSEIEINRVSRDGGGIHHSVVIEDVGAYQFMLKVSMLYPIALRPKKYFPQKFIVPMGPILWDIRNVIAKHLLKKSSKSEMSGWKKIVITDKKKRKPWEHQTIAVNDMIKNYTLGRKGSFLWIPVGMGGPAIKCKVNIGGR